MLNYFKNNKKAIIIFILIILIIFFRYEIKYIILETIRYKSKSPGVEEKLKGVHPLLRYKISHVIREAENDGLVVKITSADRDLIKNVSVGGAKWSCHIPRNAVDLNLGNIRMASPKSAWKKYADIGKEQGLRWGGDFGNYDPVHFDLNNFSNCKEDIETNDKLIFSKFEKIW